MTDPTKKDIILQHVDRVLFDRALAKCRRQEPPMTLKWKIVELVREWVESDEMFERSYRINHPEKK